MPTPRPWPHRHSSGKMLLFTEAEELHAYAKAMADIVIPLVRCYSSLRQRSCMTTPRPWPHRHSSGKMLLFTEAEELHAYAKAMADIVIPLVRCYSSLKQRSCMPTPRPWPHRHSSGKMLLFTEAQEFHAYAKAMADIVIPKVIYDSICLNFGKYPSQLHKMNGFVNQHNTLRHSRMYSCSLDNSSSCRYGIVWP